jgi:DnaK suppressor protein
MVQPAKPISGRVPKGPAHRQPDDSEAYKRRLLELEARLTNRIERETALAREQVIDTAADEGDASVADESESEDFSDAELGAAILEQVREALQRIEDGTFGRCLIDDRPIGKKRLDAVPWTPYCIKHQKLLEAASRPKPTL